MELQVLAENLRQRGYDVSVFADGAAAAAYLDGKIDGTRVAFGGSMTLKTIGLADLLRTHNDFVWHWEPTEGRTKDEMRRVARDAKVYLCSANAITEEGEIINIDGSGNRVAETLFGPEKLYFVIGRNKIVESVDRGLWRARNIAAPPNAARQNMKTPCAAKADHCYDCRSPQRMCMAAVIHYGPVKGLPTEVVLIDEDLGY